MSRYQLLQQGVLDIESGRAIFDRSSPYWAEYVEWMRAGNIADPQIAQPAPPTSAQVAAAAELAARDTIRASLRNDSGIQALRNRTPAQVDAWIDNNVTDLASARTVLKLLARVVALLARERLT